MKSLICIFLLYGAVFAITSPYLISADTVGPGSIKVSWRNNSIGATQFTILRKSDKETSFSAIDSIGKDTLAFTDNALLSVTKYFYQVVACSLDQCSAPSNTDSATTGIILPQIPSISFFWDAVAKKINSTITNKATQKIYVSVTGSENFADFLLVSAFNHVALDTGKTITWSPSAADYNAWYIFKTTVFDAIDSVFYSRSDTLYTFESASRFPSYLTKADSIIKVSDFPIRHDPDHIPCCKIGDTIVLAETGAPAKSFTLINVADVQNPKFAGYVQSNVYDSIYRTRLWDYVPVKNGFISKGNNLTLAPVFYYNFTSPANGLFTTGITNPLIDKINIMVGALDDSTIVALPRLDSIMGTRYGPMVFYFRRFSSIRITGTTISQLNRSGALGQYDGYLNAKTFGRKIYYQEVNDWRAGDGAVPYASFILDYSLQQPHFYCWGGGPLSLGWEGLMDVPIIIDSTVFPLLVSKNPDQFTAYHLADLQFVDKTKKAIYTVNDSVLSIYTYKITPYTTTGAMSHPAGISTSTPMTRIVVRQTATGLLCVLPGKEAQFDLALYNPLGKCVAQCSSKGTHTFTWRISGLARGIYLVEIRGQGLKYVNKLMIRR
jgi:hypothetical protein